MDSIKKILKSKVLWFVIIIALLGGGYMLFFAKASTVIPKYQLSAVTKGTISTSVSSTGQIATANQIDVKSRVSGIIKTLQVKNGQKVKKGDVLAILDNSDALKTVRNANLSLQNAQVSLQKTQQPNDQFTIDSAKSSLTQSKLALEQLMAPPTTLDLQTAENSVAQAERSVTQAQDSLDKIKLTDSQALNTAYNTAHTTLSNIYLNNSNIQKTDQPAFIYNMNTFIDLLFKTDTFLPGQLAANNAAATASYTKALDEYNSRIQSTTDQSTYVDTLLADTLAMQQDLYKSLESTLAIFDKIQNMVDYTTFAIAPNINSLRPTLLADIATVSTNITNLQTANSNLLTAIQNSPLDQSNAENTIASAQESLKEKQLSLAKLKAGPTTADIATAQEKINQSQQNLDKLLQGATTLDLKTSQLSVQSAKNTLTDANEQLPYYTIKSPFDGVISNVPVVASDMLGSNGVVATLINSQTMAVISLNEVDAAKIKIGDPAMMTFDALDTLTMSGTVNEIDAVGTVTQGVVTFNIKITLDTSDNQIKPGMSVSANIITEVKQDILEVPNAAIKTQNGNSYVETIDKATPVTDSSGAMTITTNTPKTQISVQTGLANDTYTEITGGLNEGDLIITKTVTTSPATATASTSSAAGANRAATSILGGGGFSGGGFAGGRPGG